MKKKKFREPLSLSALDQDFTLQCLCHDLGHITRKPVFGVSDQVRHKPGWTATEDGLRLEITYLERIYFNSKNKGADQLRSYRILKTSFLWHNSFCIISSILVPFSEAVKAACFITKTRPCNIQRFFTAVKMTIFIWFFFTIFIFLLKAYIVGTR